MGTEKFDAVVIGAGQSGPGLAASLAEAGKRVAIIERKYFGGTCINNGCIPSKTYVAHAKVIKTIRRAEEYGVSVSSFTVDLKKIKARKDSLILGMREGQKKWLESLCTVIEGAAVFESPRTVKVNGRLLEADQFFIDVGGRAVIPPIKGLDQVPYCTNSTIFDLEKLPSHLLIIGGGYVGVEFAQIFARFGSRVTILHNHSHLMPNEDEQTSKTLEEIFKKEGIEVVTHAKELEIQSNGPENIKISITCPQGNKEIVGSHLLIAAGRRANTDDLGLDKAQVKVNQRGFIEVNDQLQTSQPHIWAMGECNGKGAFTHTSYNDFQIVSDNLLKNDRRSLKDRIPIYAVFCDPPIGRVGLTQKEALAQNLPILTASLPMSAINRARIKGETDGFLSLIAHAETKQILGACFFGTECDETIQLIAEVMYAKQPYTLIERSVLIHPTVSELIPTLLSKLQPVKIPAAVS